MSRKILFIVLVLLVFGLGGLAHAQADSKDRDGLIVEVLELSGVKRHIDLLPGHLKAHGFPSRRSAQEQAAIDQITVEAFDPEVLYGLFKESFAKDFDQQRMTVLLDRLRSPLARKMAQLEVDANAADATEEIRNFASGLQSTPPSPQRLALVQRLDNAMGSSAFQTDLVIASIQSEAKFGLSEEFRKPGELERAIHFVRTEWQSKIRYLTTIQMLFAYRSASDGELREYVEFYETEVGQWFSKVSNKAMVYAVTVATERSHEKIKRVLTPREDK